MNATHLKIGRKLCRKIYRNNSSVGNGVIYMVRRDSSQKPCRPKSTGRKIPIGKRAQEERALLTFARTPYIYPLLEFVFI